MLNQESTQSQAPAKTTAGTEPSTGDPGPAIEFKPPTGLTAMFIGLFLLCLLYGFLA